MSGLIIIGASGHGKVVLDVAIKSGLIVKGFLDDNLTGEVLEYPIIGKVNDINRFSSYDEFIIGIGANEIRENISVSYDVKWATLIHPSAQIGLDVKIDKGTVIMANVVINSSSQIGEHCIINSGAIIEHDNIIKDYVHISPNATISGSVNIGERVHVGAGVTIKNNVTIVQDCIIGAGGVVINDIDKKGKYVGIPVKKI